MQDGKESGPAGRRRRSCCASPPMAYPRPRRGAEALDGALVSLP